MKYIIAVHDGIFYYYEPLNKCWWPDTGNLDFTLFKIENKVVDLILMKALEMWKCDWTKASEVTVVEAMPNV